MSALEYERPIWKKMADQLVTILMFILIGYVIISWIPPIRSGPVGGFLEISNGSDSRTDQDGDSSGGRA